MKTVSSLSAHIVGHFIARGAVSLQRINKVFLGCVLCFMVLIAIGSTPVFATLDYPLQQWETILTQDRADVIWQEISESDNVLRDGSSALSEWIGDTAWEWWIFYSEIEDSGEAWTELTRTGQWIVNRILWISGLIVLLYIAYHGFAIVINAGNSEKITNAWKAIRNAMIAVLWIALAWFFLSVIFWLINLLTN